MSKSEKLAALIETIKTRCLRNGEVCAALRTYQETPDDLPQPPEMPECVANLCRWAEVETSGLSTTVKAVREHYRQPLKLEVGKCYEDAGGNVVSIVWYDHTFADHFVGVLRLTGDPKRYTKGGECIGGTKLEKIIREVTP